MLRIKRMLAAAVTALIIVGAADRADAGPFAITFPFEDPDTGNIYTQFRLGFQLDGGNLVGLSLLSADIDLTAFTANAIFASSAPIGVLPLDGGSAYVGAFKWPEISTTSFAFDAVSGSTFGLFGAGNFAVAALGASSCSSPSPDCWISASFGNATLQLQDGNAVNLFGDAIFQGPIFDDTHLVNPGSFAFALLPGAPVGVVNGISYWDYAAVGTLQASVPDASATFSLFLIGSVFVAGCRRRLGR